MCEIDINEKELYQKYPRVLEHLLSDNSTKKNIIWATDSYKRKGYYFKDEINVYSVTNCNFIMPRSKKSKAEQSKRSKDSAEVFTPSWVCNKQNNLIDKAWFNRDNVFNTEKDNGWIVNQNKIEFLEDKSWIDYVKDTRLEISCGEAPYIASRYDTVTGEFLEINDRIGFLDRKLRVVNENCDTKEQWIEYSIFALKSVYGYEWQGDNLLLARENILMTYIDYFQNKFNEMPDEKLLIEVATIISWNFWQMDGIKYVVPNSCKTNRIVQVNLFGEEDVLESGCIGCSKGNIHHHNGIYAKIMDWDANKKVKFVDLVKGGYYL